MRVEDARRQFQELRSQCFRREHLEFRADVAELTEGNRFSLEVHNHCLAPIR